MLNLHGHNREDVIELHGQTFFTDYDLLIKHILRRRSPPSFSNPPSYLPALRPRKGQELPKHG